MSGFDTSRPDSSAVFMAKQFGSILRGYGPPVPQAGVVGDLYIDVLAWRIYEKREINGLDDWGHYLFDVPPLYRYGLKWFGPGRPDNAMGVPGDYFMHWAGYDDYGMMPVIWGPKLWEGWPENGDGGITVIAPGATGILQLGVLDEGPTKTDLMLNQLIATGILDEHIIPFPITANPGDPINQIGMISGGSLLILSLNYLYTAEDDHEVVPPGYPNGL